MQRNRFGVWVAFAVGLVAAVARADDSTTLKYKFAKGDSVIYRIHSEMKQTQTIAGMTNDNEMETDSIQSFTVDGVDDKGNYQLSVKGERLKAKAKFGPLGEFTFDSQSSERDKSSAIGAAVTPLFERLSGAVYQVVMSPTGEILEVKGYADLLRDLVESNTLAAQFAGGGTDDAARESLKEIFPHLAKNAVKPGDVWDVPFEIALAKIGKTKGKNSYRYVGADKVADRATSKLDVTGESSVQIDLDMDGVKVSGTISTTSASGTIQFDPASGRVLSNQTSISLAGNLNINANGMDIPLQNEQVMKTKVEKLDKLPN